MPTRNGIYWYYDTLTPSIQGFLPATERNLHEILDQMADQVEQYAQQNAPWEDESGDARSGLKAERVGNSIVLYHSVEYGVFLEMRWSGRYAIIQPTIAVMGPRVMAELNGVL